MFPCQLYVSIYPPRWDRAGLERFKSLLKRVETGWAVITLNNKITRLKLAANLLVDFQKSCYQKFLARFFPDFQHDKMEIWFLARGETFSPLDLGVKKCCQCSKAGELRPGSTLFIYLYLSLLMTSPEAF